MIIKKVFDTYGIDYIWNYYYNDNNEADGYWINIPHDDITFDKNGKVEK